MRLTGEPIELILNIETVFNCQNRVLELFVRIRLNALKDGSSPAYERIILSSDMSISNHVIKFEQFCFTINLYYKWKYKIGKDISRGAFILYRYGCPNSEVNRG